MTDASPPPPSPSSQPEPPILRWAVAVAVAFLGAWIFWDTDLGINWVLWITVVSAALLATAHYRYGRAGKPAIVAAMWAVIIAGGGAITVAPGRIALVPPATLLFFAIALASTGRTSLGVLRPRLAVAAPFAALAATFTGLLAEVTDGASAPHKLRRNAVARSTLITLPIVIVLVLLLADADPLFATLRAGLETIIPIDDPARIIFFLFLLALSIGVLGSVARGRPDLAILPELGGISIGRLESRVLTASMAVVMWLFVASATVSQLRNPAARAGSGVTYAEYAHRGFAELNVAATLVIGAILATRRTWSRDDAVIWRTALAAIAGVGGMVVIAFMRLVGYEQAYGYTYQRLGAQGYMLVLACMLVLLAVEVVRRAPSDRFAYHAVTAVLVIFMASTYYNTDAWIVRRNVALYQRTGHLDIEYLTDGLSRDATPALVESLSRLHDPERQSLEFLIRLRAQAHKGEKPRRWFAWNLRAMQNREALQRFAGGDAANSTAH